MSDAWHTAIPASQAAGVCRGEGRGEETGRKIQRKERDYKETADRKRNMHISPPPTESGLKPHSKFDISVLLCRVSKSFNSESSFSVE